jgi:hypothetical protein
MGELDSTCTAAGFSFPTSMLPRKALIIALWCSCFAGCMPRSRAVTPGGCQVGYMEHTGCHQLNCMPDLSGLLYLG